MSRLYETAIAIGATISKSFKGDTYNAAAALTKLSDATKKLREAEKAATSFKKLDDAVSSSKGRYDQASAALRQLGAAEKAAGGATKESTAWRKAGEREVAKSSREFDRATKAAEQNGKALREMGIDTAHLASEQKRLASTLAATERQEKSLARYESARERLFGKRSDPQPLMEKARGQFAGIARDAMVLGGVAVGAGVGLLALVKRTAEAGDQAAKMSKRIGIGVEALQELRYAGERSGASVEQVDTALGKMTESIGRHRAAKGKGAAALTAIPGLQMLNTHEGGEGSTSEADPFKHLGLSARQLATLKPDQQIDKIADAMGKLKTDAERSAIAVAIFGRGGLAMVPALKQGSTGLAQLRAEARATGGVLSADAAKQAEEFVDRMKEAELATNGLANTLGVALLPIVTDLFRNRLAWVKAHRAEITKWAADAATWIQGKAIPAFKQIKQEVATFGQKVLWLVEGAAKLTGGFGNLALVVAGLRLAPLATTLGQIAFQGVKAAAAIVQYVAAKKAADAAGGMLPGLTSGAATATGSAIGLAASAAMVIGAAAVGYAIGSYLDEKFGLSTWIADKIGSVSGQAGKMKAIENTGVEINDIALQRKKLERESLIRKYEGQGVSHRKAVYVADQLTTRPQTGLSIDLSGLNVNLAGGAKEDVEKQLDLALEKVKKHVVEHIEQKHKHKKRVGFGE